jgi:hypothetical protein
MCTLRCPGGGGSVSIGRSGCVPSRDIDGREGKRYGTAILARQPVSMASAGKREGTRVVWALRGSAVECGSGSESRVGTTVADVM